MFRGIILADNPAGHCFVLRNLFPMGFFKLVMIVLLEIYVGGKLFGKICLKAIVIDTIWRDLFMTTALGKNSLV